MKKRFLSLAMVLLLVFTMLPSTIASADTTDLSNLSDEFKSILNDEYQLEVTWTSDTPDMITFLWKYIYLHKPETCTGNFDVNAYDANTNTVSLYYDGTSEYADVEVVFNEEFSSEFERVLTNNKLILPTTCENFSSYWLSSFLFDLDETDTYHFQVANYYDSSIDDTVSLINDDCTKATIMMYDNMGYEEHHIVELGRITEMSDNYKSHLSSNGKIELDASVPKNEDDLISLLELLVWEDGISWGNFADDFSAMDFAVDYEIHRVEIEYHYDTAIAQKMRGYFNNLPLDQIFKVKDLELVNYWVNTANNNDADTLDSYSGELKKLLGYNNIKYYVDNRAGGDEPFSTIRLGMAIFSYEDVVYYSTTMLSTDADHVIYVPSGTENTPNAMMEAAQNRIDEYIGEGKVELSYAGTLFDVWESYYPGETQDVFEDLIDIENVTGNEFAYKLTVNGSNGQTVTHNIVILADSSKMVNPEYKVVDVINNVEVTSTSSEIPLDTSIQTEKLSSGTKYDKIIELLDVEKNVTYDISLHSDSLDKNISELEDGTFEVRIPLTNELKGKKLTAYYVDKNNNIVKYDVEETVDGYGVFKTNHFSIYTIAESVKDVPNTKDDSNLFVWMIIFGVGVLTIVGAKKKYSL